MYNHNNMQDSVDDNELIISNMLKAFDIRCVKDSMYPDEIDSLINVVRTHIMSNVTDKGYQLPEYDNANELMISNMLMALDIRCVRDSMYPGEIKLLLDFIRSHILLKKDYLLDLQNNKSNKKIKTKSKQ